MNLTRNITAAMVMAALGNPALSQRGAEYDAGQVQLGRCEGCMRIGRGYDIHPLRIEPDQRTAVFTVDYDSSAAAGRDIHLDNYTYWIDEPASRGHD